jgi:hypothetical protein
MRDARILLLDTFFRIKLGDENTKPKSLTTKLAIANEQLCFILKNVSSNRMRVSRIVTAKKIGTPGVHVSANSATMKGPD